jgi:hypothetical protein
MQREKLSLAIAAVLEARTGNTGTEQICVILHAKQLGPADQVPIEHVFTIEHHIALCLVAYLIVERECVDQRLTWRKLKRTHPQRPPDLSAFTGAAQNGCVSSAVEKKPDQPSMTRLQGCAESHVANFPGSSEGCACSATLPNA